MSQVSKTGKSLSRRRNYKQDFKEENLNKTSLKENSSELFCTGHNSSIKHESSEDSSLLSLDTPLKHGSCSKRYDANETKFSIKREMSLENKAKEAQLENKTKITETKTIFDEETIIGDDSIDIFKFPVESTSVFDDSSLVFEKNNGSEENKAMPNIEITNINHSPNIQFDSSTHSDDDVSISYPKRNESNTVKDKDAVNTTEISESETLNQCPICFKTTTKYISHMKSCAAKNNLTTEQLLSVLKLHKKQLAERKELGLRPPVSSYRAKVSPKKRKAVDKKVPIDSNLQLAIALSASLQSAEENEVIQEAEALKEAGLSDEADRKMSTLEKFGFALEMPSVIRNVKNTASLKTRTLVPSLLMRRTKEDRERIVTEKVAIVLISEEDNASLDSFVERRPTIKSKKLLKLWFEDCILWDKAHCLSEEQRGTFYVQSLSEFIEPSTAEVGEGLRRLSQLPGRLNTPLKDKLSSPMIPDFSGTRRGFSSASTVRRYSVTPSKTNKLSEDWRKLVGNPFLSDVCVRCNQEEIPAHKLVLHVRCPAILNDVVRQDCGKEIIILDDYIKGSVMSFLEFVYTGNFDDIKYLSSRELKSLISLTEKFDYSELKNELISVENARRNQEKTLEKNNVKKELFGDCYVDNTVKEFTHLKRNGVDNETSAEYNYPNINLENDSEIHSQKYDSKCLDLSCYKDKGSPDMFGDSDVVIDTESYSPERDDLAMLASLVGKTYTQVGGDSGKNISYPSDDNDCTNTSSVSGSASVKRKALSSSLSDDENGVQVKKICTDLSHSEDIKKDEMILDLTQSSSSSKGESPTKNALELRGESDDCKIVTTIDVDLNESVEELTQQNPSSPPSCIEDPPQTRDLADSYNNDFPVWDGFEDDCWYYNNEVNTPVKNSSLKNCSLTKSANKSPEMTSKMKYIPFESKSPENNSCRNLSLSPRISPSREVSLIKDRSSVSCTEVTPEVCLTNYHEEKNIALHSIDSTEGNKLPMDPSKHLKTRKNLSFQFSPRNDVERSKDDSSSESHEASSPVHTICISPEKVENKCAKKSFKKDSLDAIKRLLDDSFEINDSRLISIDALASTPKGTCISNNNVSDVLPSTSLPTNINCETRTNSAVTPSPEIYVSDSVTPLPNYSGMKTPTLKKELKRFGIKPTLGKSKAKLLLRHIYDQTHPFIAEPIGTKDVFKQPKGQPPRSPSKTPQHVLTTVDLVDSDSEEPCSQTSTCSSVSSSATLPEESFFEVEEDLLTQAPTTLDGDVRTSIRNLILNDPELHKKILMYEPIFVEDLMAILKSKGVKSKSNQIIEFLDEQCITFRTTSWKTRNEKRRQKQKSPKKKTKGKTSGEHSRSVGLSPKKHESPTKTTQSKTTVGRPRKNTKKMSIIS